jgi:Flp pilus assembly protein TadG
VKKLAKILRDERGASALEFALTAPAFFLFVFGIIEFGLLLWTQIGLQHGAEVAARCASVAQSTPLNLNTAQCAGSNAYATVPIALPLQPKAIESYAAQNAYGLSLPVNPYHYSPPPSQACGNQVNASYSFQFYGLSLGPVTLTAQACSP